MNAKHILIILSFCVSSTVAASAAAQSTATTSEQTTLLGYWLVTVEGEAATRTLIVTGEAPTSDGALLVAKYGMSNERQGPIEAKLLRVGDQRQMVLVTQAGTKITALEQSNKDFQGTFALKNGTVKTVTIVRSSESDLRDRARSKTASWRAEAERWLAKDKFLMHFKTFGKTYKTFPKEGSDPKTGYTYFYGWDDVCGQGRVPTTYTIDDSGKLVVEFKMPSFCRVIKYVFAGSSGEIYIQESSGSWTRRPAPVELREE